MCQNFNVQFIIPLKTCKWSKEIICKPKDYEQTSPRVNILFEYLFRKTIYHIEQKRKKREYKNPLQVPVRKCSKSKNCDNNISTRINDNRKT